jgi:hypothetical protein
MATAMTTLGVQSYLFRDLYDPQRLASLYEQCCPSVGVNTSYVRKMQRVLLESNAFSRTRSSNAASGPPSRAAFFMRHSPASSYSGQIMLVVAPSRSVTCVICAPNTGHRTECVAIEPSHNFLVADRAAPRSRIVQPHRHHPRSTQSAAGLSSGVCLALTSDQDAAMTRILQRLQQLCCALHGHDAYLQLEQGRMCLRCLSCGHETPGWDLQPIPSPPHPALNRPSLPMKMFCSTLTSFHRRATVHTH